MKTHTFTRLFKNTLYLLLSNALTPFISFVLIIYVARFFGTQGLGDYTSIITLTFFFEILASFGLQDLIARDLSVDIEKARTYLTASIILALLTSLISFFLLYITTEILNYPKVIAHGAKILGLSLFFHVLTDYCRSFFQALQKMQFTSLINIMEVVFKVTFGILVLYSGYPLITLIWAIFVTRIIISIVSFLLLTNQQIYPSLIIDVALCKKIATQALTFLLISFIATMYWKIDILILSKMKSSAEVGLYSAAYRFIDMMKAFLYCYIAAVFPVISIDFSHCSESFKRNSTMSVRYLYVFTLPICVGTSIIAPELIHYIYGPQFTDSVLVLRILVWTICIFPIAVFFAKTLVASHNQKYDLFSNLVAVLINIALNLLLIPRFAHFGAAMAAVASIVFLMLFEYYFVSRILFKINIASLFVKPTLCACIMGFFTYLFRHLNPLLVILLSSIIYVISIFVLRVISQDEVNFLKALWNGRSGLLSISK